MGTHVAPREVLQTLQQIDVRQKQMRWGFELILSFTHTLRTEIKKMNRRRKMVTRKKKRKREEFIYWVLTVVLVSLTSLICLLAGETEPGGCGVRQEGSSKLSSVSKLASIIIPLTSSCFSSLGKPHSLSLSLLSLSLKAARLPPVSQATE